MRSFYTICPGKSFWMWSNAFKIKRVVVALIPLSRSFLRGCRDKPDWCHDMCTQLVFQGGVFFPYIGLLSVALSCPQNFSCISPKKVWLDLAGYTAHLKENQSIMCFYNNLLIKKVIKVNRRKMDFLYKTDSVSKLSPTWI